MRLCVIGNSHVGMLRAAMRAPEADGLSLSFFAKAGSGLERATVRGSLIVADDPDLAAAQVRFGMPRVIDVAGFDAVVFVAGTASVFSAMKILKRHRVSTWPPLNSGRPAVSPDVAAAGDRTMLSNAAYVAALADWTRAGVSYRYAHALRSATDVPMFLVPQPYPGVQVLTGSDPRYSQFREVRTAGTGEALVAGLADAHEAVFSEIGDVHVLHQPRDTVAHGFLTDRSYTRDAVRVDGGTAQRSTDILHVGAAYGTRVLARIASVLDPFVPLPYSSQRRNVRV